MILKYDVEIEPAVIQENLRKITNQIYKLLPNWEEGVDWKTPLTTIIEELAGMNRLFPNSSVLMFSLICKLEGLFTLSSEKDFFIFRKTIFECLNIVGRLMQTCH